MKSRICTLWSFILLPLVTLLYASSLHLVAVGTGETQDQARQNALSLLSSQIVSKVASTHSTSKASTQEGFSKTSLSKVQITSDVFLSGVQYINMKSKSGHKVKAIFDDEAFLKTLDHLASKVSENVVGDLKGMSAEELDSLAEVLEFMRALVYYPIDFEDDRKIKSYKSLVDRQAKRLFYRSKDFGSITIAEDVHKDAKVFVQGKSYAVGEEIFLKPKKYTLRVSKKGFKDIKVRLGISGKKYLYRKVQLVSKSLKKIPVKVVFNDFESVKAQDRTVQKMLRKFSFDTKSDDYSYVLEFSFDETANKQGVYIQSDMRIDLAILDSRGEYLKELSSSKKYLSSSKTLDKKRRKNIDALLSKLLKKARLFVSSS